MNVTNTDNIASIEVHPSISLYQFNINGIISKNDLYNFLIVSVQDDRTPSVDIVLIQNQIFNQFTSQELVYIDAVGTYTFLTQHQDSDGKIGTASVIVTVV